MGYHVVMPLVDTICNACDTTISDVWLKDGVFDAKCSACGSGDLRRKWNGSTRTGPADTFEEMRIVDPLTGLETSVRSSADLDSMKARYAASKGVDPSQIEIAVRTSSENRERKAAIRDRVLQARRRFGITG